MAPFPTPIAAVAVDLNNHTDPIVVGPDFNDILQVH